jgi:hypothetical protein
MRIKSWRKFFESVEESLEDIKWMLVDYDYDEKNVIGSSNDLIVYRWGKSQSDSDHTERVKRLAKPEGWDVDFVSSGNTNILTLPEVFCIFYKGNLEDSIISYLNEKFGNLETDTYGHYSTSEIHSKAFNISPNKLNQCIASLEPMLYQIPAYCYGITYDSELFSSSYDKFIKLFKKWLLERYQIIADYIVLL